MTVVEDVIEQGFSLIRSFLPTQDTISAASTLGALFTAQGINQKQVLTPKKVSDSTPNTYSGNFGVADFPMHTDLAHWKNPPRLLVLRCIVGATSVKTRMIDFSKLASEGESSELRQILVQPRRPVDGSRSLLAVLDISEVGTFRYRWDALFLEPATLLSGRKFSVLKDLIENHQKIEICLENPGDTLVVDNWRMLHGRSSVTDVAVARKIERVYLSSLFGGGKW